jgi:hypothetical protein
MTTIYRDYDAEALERQYMPRYTIPGDPEIRRAKWAAMSAAYRERAVLERDIAYGPSGGPAARSPAPVACERSRARVHPRRLLAFAPARQNFIHLRA